MSNSSTVVVTVLLATASITGSPPPSATVTQRFVAPSVQHAVGNASPVLTRSS